MQPQCYSAKPQSYVEPQIYSFDKLSFFLLSSWSLFSSDFLWAAPLICPNLSHLNEIFTQTLDPPSYGTTPSHESEGCRNLHPHRIHIPLNLHHRPHQPFHLPFHHPDPPANNPVNFSILPSYLLNPSPPSTPFDDATPFLNPLAPSPGYATPAFHIHLLASTLTSFTISSTLALPLISATLIYVEVSDTL